MDAACTAGHMTYKYLKGVIAEQVRVTEIG